MSDVADESTTGQLHPVKFLELALIARRYYLENRSKVEIAEEFNISRFRVARLLDEAVVEGVVRIEIKDHPTHVDPELSHALKERFGLDRALVATVSDYSESAARRSVAAVGAALLHEILTPDDVVGIGWGRTLHEVVAQLPELPPCTAVQIVGGIPDSELWMNSVDLVRRFAERSGGQMHTFLLPFIVDDAALAARLREDAGFVRASRLFDDLTVVVAAIGSWDPPRSGLYDVLSAEERDSIRATGAIADMFGVLVSEAGELLRSTIEERSIAITADQLRQVPSVIGVAAGTEKVGAIRAVLSAGLLDSLVTDRAVAAALLEA